MDVLIVQTQSVRKLERSRTALRNFVVRHLRNFDKRYALAAFYSKEDKGSEWRLSLVKIDYDTERDKSGKIKIKEEIVPASRFSFLVGANEHAYTAQKQLLPILTNDVTNPLIEKEEDGDGSIEGAFSVETVTDEFFEQYKDLFIKLVKHFGEKPEFQNEFRNTGIDVNRFTKKLLGQIVFLYFLQKKGWLGVPKEKKMGEGAKRFLQNQFDKYRTEGNYFKSFLRYLFYEALAREHKDLGIKYYFEKLDCKIPFLNGGLFEAEYDWENSPLTIPNELFRNDEKNKFGDKGTGILDVFDRYNFTIKEDEPLEKEVAVDPEMLGKVFENMLEITERKNKGAYYTPREVVHYMCQESLIHYLDNVVNDNTKACQPLDSDQLSLVGGSVNKKGTGKLELDHGEIQVPKKDLEIFIRNGHFVLENEMVTQTKGKETKSYKFKLPESIRTYAHDLDNYLSNIKICDPAIGSGAFPVGLLHEIVIARQVLNSFIQDDTHTPYWLKRHAIQESIYGVDIDSSAVDIARLRLWLSLIVDEEDYDNIEALPNLDYKIVSGSSLVGMPENAMRDLILEQELEDLKKSFFNQTDDLRKKDLRNSINKKIRMLLDSAEQFAGYKIEFDFKLYFSEVWHYKDGFDVIIANPPYVSHDKFTKQEKQFYKNHYSTYEPYADKYCYFIELALRLQNRKSVLCFITSNSYLRADYGRFLRRKLLDSNHIDSIINIEDYQVFKSAIVNSAVLISSKSKSRDKSRVVNATHKGTTDFSTFVNRNSFYYSTADFNRKTWNLITPANLELLKSIEEGRPTLDELKTKIRLGLATGDNNAFVINEIKKEELIQKDIKNKAIIKPTLRGRDIFRYHYKQPDEYILLTKNGIDVESQFPTLFQYFDSLGEDFKKRGAKGQHWTNLRACSFFEDFQKEKIIWIELTDKGRFALCNEEIYLLNSAYFLLPPQGIEAKYLLAILNSSIIHFYLFNTAETSGMGTSRWINNHVKEFPIEIATKEEQIRVSKLVEILSYSLAIGADRTISDFFDALIDGLVFEMYFNKEIKSVGKILSEHIGAIESVDENESKESNFGKIQKLFQRLYHPNHPVRNNLETLDSIQEVRIIKESIK